MRRTRAVNRKSRVPKRLVNPKKGRSRRSGQVQGGNAQEGLAVSRDTALQQYGTHFVAPQEKQRPQTATFRHS
jgi:hypothetical protein